MASPNKITIALSPSITNESYSFVIERDDIRLGRDFQNDISVFSIVMDDQDIIGLENWLAFLEEVEEYPNG